MTILITQNATQVAVNRTVVTVNAGVTGLQGPSIQVSQPDVVLGRVSAGPGNPEEIPCTPAGRALLDDADATAQIATLGAVATTDSRLSDARTPTAHTHPESDVVNLVTDLAGKAPTVHSHLLASGATDVTATAAEVNKLAGLATTAAELGYVHGVTSAIQAQMDDKEPIGKYSRMTVQENDLLGYPQAASFYPLYPLAIASGSLAFTTYVSMQEQGNHPGMIAFRSSTTANSGYLVTGQLNSGSPMSGGETCEIIFKVTATSGTTIRMGYHTTSSSAAPTDGVWIEIVETTLSGKTNNSTSEVVTTSTYTITQGTWYRMKIAMNANATLATFTLVTCADGMQVWTDTINSHIPTARVSPLNIIATNSGTTATNLITLDWYRYSCSRVLVR